MAAEARAKDGAAGAGAAQQPAPKSPLKPAAATDEAPPSPALLLQEALRSGLAEPRDEKWPAAKTLGFIVATCGAFWGLVAVGVAIALK